MSNLRVPGTKHRVPAAAFLALAILLLAGLACGLPFGGDPTPRSPEVLPSPTLPPLPTQTPLPLPPGLVESDPPLSGEMPVNGPITLFFNQPMNRQSVEAALTGQMQQELTFTWVDDTTVVVYLSEDLAPETALAFSLEGDVRSQQGVALSEPIRLNYVTAGYLRLVQALPTDEARDVDPTSAIVASFNRPVVALGADPATQPPAFSVEPAAVGRGVWLNTSTFVFYPEPALAGGETYTVRLNPDLKSTDGTPLEEEVSWSFRTAMPQLLSVEPSTETPWPLDPTVRLTFNQPMDRASVESWLDLVFPDGRSVPGEFAWLEDDTQLIFTPAGRLPRNTTFNLVLDGKAQAVGGSLLRTTFSAMVITVPELEVIRSEPAPGSVVDIHAGLLLEFSAPLPPDRDLLPFVELQPAVSDLQASVDQYSLRLFGTFQANTDYVLSLSPELGDIWGGRLGQEYQLAFQTSPQPPNLSILSGADAIFLTPQDLSLVVQAVNISEVPLTVGSVPLEDLFALLGPNGYELRQNYQSANQVSFTQPLDLPPDESQEVQVFLTPDQQALAPGIYFVRLNFSQEQGSEFGNIFSGPYLVVVSNVQLTFKLSAADALVWAVDLRSGEPVAEAPVSLLGEDGQPIASGVTDQDGIFTASFAPRSDPYSPVYALLGEPGQDTFGMTFSNWTSGIDPWDFDIDVDLRAPGLFLYLYSDRPMYRPGDTVYFKALVRNQYNGRYSPPGISSLPLTVSGADGRELMTLDLPLGAYGTAHGQIELPQDAQPGYYSINSTLVPNTYFGFQVASYRKPEINLAVSFTPAQVRAGEALAAEVNARYFFDAPAGNLEVHWALYAAQEAFHLPGYQVGQEDTSWLSAYTFPGFGPALGALVSEGDAKTDPAGLLALELPTRAEVARQRYTLEVTVQDESGQPVSARSSVIVNPDDFFIGLRPDAWVAKAGDPLGFEVQGVDWEKEPLEGLHLRAEFSSVVFRRLEPASSELFQGQEFAPQYTLVASTDFATGPEGLARLAFTPPQPGTYMLDVFNPATEEGARSQLLVWVSGEGQTIWPSLPNSRLRLTADRDSYRPGDTAQVFIPNPFGRQVTALLTTERSVIMDHQILQIPPGGYLLSMPLTEAEAPNVVLSLTLMGRSENDYPDFRQGYVNLPVEPVQEVLDVELLTQPERSGPGDEVQFDVRVTDAAGLPVQGEFSLAVVDLAALALADPNSKDILSAFYGEQPAGVRTSLSLAVYNRRLTSMPLRMGGGGGDTSPSVVRESFPDTAYWGPEIVTDASGRATVRMVLPDTLTTWQADLRGLTMETQVGQAQAQVVTTKELLVRPVAPRFFVAQDYAQVSTVVQNNSDTGLQVQVSLQAKGFVLDDPAAALQSLEVPAGGRARFEWWGTVQDTEEVDLVFSAKGVAPQGTVYSDAARPALGALPVLRYYTPQSFRTAGMLDGAGSVEELVSLPRSYIPDGGSLEVELAPSLAAAMLQAMEALESAPFESSEQILSSFLPNMETYRTLQDFDIQDASLEPRLDRALNEGLVRLLSRQNYDGGWAWWEGGESDPFISSYMLFGLQRARLAGISVNQNAIDQVIGYLKGATSQTPQASTGDWPERTWEWDRLAFQQFSLAQLGEADPVVVDAVFQERARLSAWAQALLVLTLEKLQPGSQEARDLLSSIQGDAIRSASGAFWELSQDEEGLLAAGHNMQTDLTNTAIVLYVLAQRDPGSPLVADTVRFLMANRGADRAWASTYTTAWTLIGLDQVLRGTGELGADFAFGASLNNNPIADGAAKGVSQLTAVNAQVPIQRLYPDYPNVLTIQRQGGTGRLYYTANLQVSRPVDEVTPLSNGLSIERAVTPFGAACQKAECDPIVSARQGEKVTVRLSLTLPQDVYYLAVSDFIPAGAEVLDTSLKTSQIGEEGAQPGGEVIYNPRRPFDKGWGWWYFSSPQIYDDHIAWTASSLPAGSYELTYTLVLLQPGLYRVLPARAWQLYFPDVQANSAGSVFEIKP